ncbi:MAG: biotin carboxylase N-terminal domain-containing protein [Alphaproteobacteria bacterium]
MFETLLIANRGEIACRIIATARRLGLRTIAVYSDADAESRHVALADSALHIGPSPARESYLDIDRLVAAVRRSGADAVHPGYGFLSENAAFAEAVAGAGAVFVGPPPAAIRAMGSKVNAKRIMAEAGVPLVPGYHEDDQDPAILAEAAATIGYPVLIKASAGGGGRGMRRVDAAADFIKALEGAQREAKSGFGDDTVLIEKYVTRPRHIEMQVFADRHGNAVHLFERDCSIQRRHQKVVEEAPAPGVIPTMRAAMGDAAIAAARAIGYEGAGTVEFIVDTGPEGQPGDFYFMEMNTRLQVEHPVTEMITGLDLVEWQLIVAAGGPLPRNQDDIAANGHAVEVRLYAENPEKNFMPQTGRLAHLRFPAPSPHIRIDTGIREGDSVSMFYDPMIAKIIAWDHDRDGALRRLRSALRTTEIAGLTTNLPFLAAIAAHPAFGAAALETGFIDIHAADIIPESPPASREVLALAALSELLDIAARTADRAAHSPDPHSPWHARDGWRLCGAAETVFHFTDGTVRNGPVMTIRAIPEAGGHRLTMDGCDMLVRGALDNDGAMLAEIGGARMTATVRRDGDSMQIVMPGHSHRLLRVDPAAIAARQAPAAGGRLTAPMPGRIVAIHTAAGDRVRAGQALVVLEAMKMEHIVVATADGVVAQLRCAAGDQVADGDELLTLEGP